MEFIIKLQFATSKIQVAYHTISQKIKGKRDALFWAVVDLPLAILLCKLPFRQGNEARRDKWRGRLWSTNHTRFLGTRPGMTYTEVVSRRKMLDSAVTHFNPGLMKMLQDCAVQLNTVQASVVADGAVPVLAPMHFCSDLLATLTAALVAPRKSYVFSIYGQSCFGATGDNWCREMDMELIQHHPNDPPVQFKRMLREVGRREANLVIFPDILPQFTSANLGRTMPSRDVTVFNRPGRLHSGPETLARMLKGRIIPFYLYWEKQTLKIKISAPCAGHPELAGCIEQALRECGDQWLLWHFPSVFYFNDGGEK